jgi:hypothetical protein
MADCLARECARRGSQRDTYDERKESGRLNLRGFRDRWIMHGKRRHQYKGCDPNDGWRISVTGPHGVIALSIAIAFAVQAQIRLTAVHGAIYGIAGGRHIRCGEGFGKGGDARSYYRKQRRDRLKLSRNGP